MPPRPSMSATKYSKSYYYSERAQLLLDKRGDRQCANQVSATTISHSAPDHAILCSCGWEMSEPLSF